VFNFFRSLKSQDVLVEKPQHIAIIMDGNGRWAKKRFMPRISGHRKGLESVRAVITQCQKLNIPFLTLFAFSTENWLRPIQEVNFLMTLFQDSLKKESSSLIKNNIRFKVIGDYKPFSKKLINKIKELESHTKKNTGLTLTIAINYGGRWDILNAVNEFQKKNHSKKLLTKKKSYTKPFFEFCTRP